MIVARCHRRKARTTILLVTACVLAGACAPDRREASQRNTAPATSVAAGATTATDATAAPSPDGTAGGSAPASSTASSAPATTTSDEEPTPGGRLTIASGDFVANDFFPGNALGAQAFSYVQMAWPLFLNRTGSFELEPAIGSGYDVSADGLVHTVTVGDGFTFHDGSPVDADAVVANLRALLYEDDPLRGPGPYTFVTPVFGGFPGVVSSIEATDASTVTITLSEPRADLRVALASMNVFNPAVMAANPAGWATDTAQLANAGSGPFRVTEFQPGVLVEYERYGAFPEPAYLDGLRIQLVADTAARGLAIRGGEAGIAVDIARPDYEDLTASGEYDAVVSNPGIASFIAVNAQNPLLADARVREALTLALDRATFVDAFYPADQAQVATQGVLVPGTTGYDQDAEALPYDPERARELLDEAGATGSTFRMLAPQRDDPALLEAIVAAYGEVGITVELTIVDLSTWLGTFPEYDLTPFAFGNSGQDLALLQLMFVPQSDTFTLPTDPAIPGLLTEAEQALNPDQQAEALREIQRLAVADLATIPLAAVSSAAVVDPAVRDFALSASPADSQHRTWIASS